MDRAFLVSFYEISLVVYGAVCVEYRRRGTCRCGSVETDHPLCTSVSSVVKLFSTTGAQRCTEETPASISLRSKQQNRHADIVLHPAGSRSEEDIGEKSVPMSAHGYQIATFLLDPFD